MSRPTSVHHNAELISGLKADNPVAFAQLYDQYAPALLGVITKIVLDKAEAVSLLEMTFTKVRSQIQRYQAEKQPLFTWMLNIARCSAIEALKERRQMQTPVFQLTTTGNVVSPTLQAYSTTLPAGNTNSTDETRLKELLESVLFKNCTPEEAAASMGLPIATARQQLRRAMQQLQQRAI